MKDSGTCEISPVVGPALPGAGVEHLLHKPVEVLPRLPVGGAHLEPDGEHGAGPEVASVQLRHVIPVSGPVHLCGALPASGNLKKRQPFYLSGKAGGQMPLGHKAPLVTHSLVLTSPF